jgi:hypothetical protein
MRIRVLNFLAALLVLTVVKSGALLAQSGTSSTPAEGICGTVHDPSGAVISGAAVSLTSSEAQLSAQTDPNGTFCFHHLELGEYLLTAETPGFQPDQ